MKTVYQILDNSTGKVISHNGKTFWTRTPKPESWKYFFTKNYTIVKYQLTEIDREAHTFNRNL